MQNILADALAYFSHFPAPENTLVALILLACFSVLALCVLVLFCAPFFGTLDNKKEAAVVPKEMAAITLRKDGGWMKVYIKVFGVPRDLCSFFYKNILLVVGMMLLGMAIAGLMLSMIGAVSWILYGVYEFIWITPSVATGAAGRVYELIASAGKGLAVGALWVMGQSYTYLALGGAVLLLLLVVFFRSTAWKVTRLRLKAWKERHCPLIRVE